MGRAAGDAGIRQVRGAGLELDPVEVQSQSVGRDLGERGPGALPHVVGADLHHAGAVALDHRARRGLKHQRRKRRGAHAPADQETGIVAHLARREGSLRPTKTLGASRVAFPQGLGGERLAGNRLDLGIILDAEVERVHAAGPGHFVDRALQRDRSGRLARRAHEQRRAGVDTDRLMRGLDGGTGIERVGRIGRRLEEIVERARCGLGVMIERGQTALAVGADAKPLPGRRAMADRAVHLLAAQHQLDGSSDQSGRHDAENLRPGDQALGAEAAAEERAADMNLVRRDAEQSRDPSYRHRHALARRIDRERVAVPSRHDRVRLHRIVILRRRLEGRLDALRCGGKPCLDIAALDHGRIADADGGRHKTLVRTRARRAQLELRISAQAVRPLRSQPRASRQSPPRSPGWRNAPCRSAIVPSGT